MCVVEFPYQVRPSLIFSSHPQPPKAPPPNPPTRIQSAGTWPLKTFKPVSVAAGCLNYVTLRL